MAPTPPSELWYGCPRPGLTAEPLVAHHRGPLVRGLQLLFDRFGSRLTSLWPPSPAPPPLPSPVLCPSAVAPPPDLRFPPPGSSSRRCTSVAAPLLLSFPLASLPVQRRVRPGYTLIAALASSTSLPPRPSTLIRSPHRLQQSCHGISTPPESRETLDDHPPGFSIYTSRAPEIRRHGMTPESELRHGYLLPVLQLACNLRRRTGDQKSAIPKSFDIPEPLYLTNHRQRRRQSGSCYQATLYLAHRHHCVLLHLFFPLDEFTIEGEREVVMFLLVFLRLVGLRLSRSVVTLSANFRGSIGSENGWRGPWYWNCLNWGGLRLATKRSPVRHSQSPQRTSTRGDGGGGVSWSLCLVPFAMLPLVWETLSPEVVALFLHSKVMILLLALQRFRLPSGVCVVVPPLPRCSSDYAPPFTGFRSDVRRDSLRPPIEKLVPIF
ncbi:hypothetical protein J5N97_030096 [Dioscorea zingiberensis]|uniref:Uncharacterized protein n=1 Tax=Dioscorea zingiberensis TaxID=325984 RepID=A0A9D5H3T6_9LILI|nr:hypothetical protein J5N97_030096 [Dioscorea zingiberensis]